MAKTSELPDVSGLATSSALSSVASDAASAATDAAAAKTAAQAITGYALQGSGNSTQTDIASTIGTPATGQPSTLFAAIAASGGGGGTGDAKESTSQSILAAVEDNGDTAITLVKDIATNVAKDATVAKEAAATANKNQVISAIDNTLSVNMLATGLSAMAGVPMHVITDDGITTAYTLNVNELYYFNNRSSDLNLTLDLTTVIQGEAADFHLIVQVTTGPLTVTIKDSNNNDVVWSRDKTPDFLTGTIYEIGIINNLALYVEYVI